MLGEENHQFGIKGSDNASFKEDTIIHHGYVYEHAPEHPFSNEYGRVRQHRLVAESQLIPPVEGGILDAYIILPDWKPHLSPDYDVHHNDGITTNNNPDNLSVLSRGQHTKLHNNTKIITRDSNTGRITGVKKLGEFRETPEVDNPEPSLPN